MIIKYEFVELVVIHFLLILDWHYLAVKKLSTLLRGITSKYHGDFYCLNCLHSFRTESKLISHEKVCTNKDFCHQKRIIY